MAQGYDQNETGSGLVYNGPKAESGSWIGFECHAPSKELDWSEIGPAFSVRIFTGIWKEMKQVSKSQTRVEKRSREKRSPQTFKRASLSCLYTLSFFSPIFSARNMIFLSLQLLFSFQHDQSTKLSKIIGHSTPKFSGSWWPWRSPTLSFIDQLTISCVQSYFGVTKRPAKQLDLSELTPFTSKKTAN